ncbi:M15 family metallopeptidase [Streptomyces hoynatensis]|uniref:M15 family metallopeptidase n=1 Tax=Streptomyces hoynatensis TaxID=1141874 RepID=UPI001F4D3619|nr:M15 family metallopeptidase [Streptomyces hoynatensis]
MRRSRGNPGAARAPRAAPPPRSSSRPLPRPASRLLPRTRPGARDLGRDRSRPWSRPLAAGCLLLASLTGCLAADAGPGHAGRRAPEAFVALRDVAPGIDEEIRYASAHNFVGRVIDGYREPVCLLTRRAARALRAAQRALAEDGYSLLVYDCYRPQRAVDHFLRWADDPADTGERREFYPHVPKDRLFREGYLAARSGHSRGSTVDVTLQRPRGHPVDMGTHFDYFDPRSKPEAKDIGKRQRAAREVLHEALGAAGFERADTEWWHFTYREEPFPDRYFDFPVTREALRGPSS